jgi:hypothetical protein
MKRLEPFELPIVKLSYKQKVILAALQDEFHGHAFGPQLLKETENETLKQFSINEITWHILRLREAALVTSEKKTYEGRVLNEYSISDYIKYGVIDIK